jgi:hypothetical protein
MNAPFSPAALSTFTQSVIVMLEGMAGIFIFMAIFYGLITLLNYIYKERPAKEL